VNDTLTRAAITFVVALGALGAFLYCRHYWDDAPGVMLYVEASRCMLDRLPLQACNPFYTYPPIFAFLTIPLVPLPLVLQNLAWYLLTVGGLGACFFLSARLAQQLAPGRWSRLDLVWLYGLSFLVSLKFVFAAISSQSYDVWVVLLILVGLTHLAEDNSDRGAMLAGACFACAAALKATPLLFLPYLLVKRHYRAAAIMVLVLVVVSLLPDLVFTLGRKSGGGSYLWAWLHQVAEPALTEKLQGNLHTFWTGTNPNNNSLRGLVGALVDDTEPHSPFAKILYAVYAIYTGLVALLILRTGDRHGAPTVDGALLLISMLMLSPMSSESHYVALIPAIFAVVAVWQRGDPGMRTSAGIFLFVNFVLIHAAARDLVGMTVTSWAKDHRLLVIAVLLYVLFFAVFVFRSQRATALLVLSPAVRQSAE
jgi:hypothetical protein